MTKPKILLISALFIFSLPTFCQDNYREIGLSINDEFNFGFVYKKQKAERKYLVYDAAANFSILSSNGNNTVTAGLFFALGFERRVDIAEKVQFLHGWQPSLSLGTITNSDNLDILTIEPGLGYRLGFLYSFSDNLYVSLEGIANASMSILFNDDIEGTPTSTNIGFSPNNVTLNLIYRFQKKG